MSINLPVFNDVGLGRKTYRKINRLHGYTSLLKQTARELHLANDFLYYFTCIWYENTSKLKQINYNTSTCI